MAFAWPQVDKAIQLTVRHHVWQVPCLYTLKCLLQTLSTMTSFTVLGFRFWLCVLRWAKISLAHFFFWSYPFLLSALLQVRAHDPTMALYLSPVLHRFTTHLRPRDHFATYERNQSYIFVPNTASPSYLFSAATQGPHAKKHRTLRLQACRNICHPPNDG